MALIDSKKRRFSYFDSVSYKKLIEKYFYRKSPNEAYLDNVDVSLNTVYEHGILIGAVCVVLIKQKTHFLHFLAVFSIFEILDNFL
jgi:hypothetical protein